MNKLVVGVVLLLSVSALVAAKHHQKKVMWNRPAVNQELIDQINNDDSVTWTAGVNAKFANMKLNEVKALLGTKLGGPKPKAHVPHHKTAIPTNYDVRDDWGKKCPSTVEIRDQSKCGSCWAFGAAEAMTDRICIANGGASNPHLSATDLLACCDECGDGCDGGYPGSAWDYWVSDGLVTGGNYSNITVHNGCFPYPMPPCEHHVNGTHYPPCPDDEYPTPSCPTKCVDPAIDWKTDKHYGKTSYSVDGEANIQQELLNHGSLEVAFTVYEDFLAYKTGVYKHVSGEALGGHAVKMIGWGVEGTTKYWTIVNSWNDDWGDNGIFKILRGTDECGIEGEVVGGLPK